jgi:ATP-dependent Lhr-like helicase
VARGLVTADAIDVLRTVRKQPRNGETITISAADPLNLTGVVLPGPRIPAIGANTVTYTDGAVPTADKALPIGEPA